MSLVSPMSEVRLNSVDAEAKVREQMSLMIERVYQVARFDAGVGSDHKAFELSSYAGSGELMWKMFALYEAMKAEIATEVQ